MKKAIIPIIVFLCIILFVYIIPWLIISNGCSIISGQAKPEKPATTYGEFPFELTYRIGDKTVKEKGTYVFEFQSIEYSIGYGGYYYTWKGYIKETGKEAIYITEDDERTIYCSVGDPDYYIYHTENEALLFPYFYDVLHEDSDGEYYTSKEVMEHFDLEIIEYKLSDPIQGKTGDG